MPMFNASVEVEKIEIVVDGQITSVPKGVSVAVALLLIDAVPFRQSKIDQSPRAPYCLMGVCAECLVTINEEPGQFACQQTVQPDMRVERNIATNTGRSSSNVN